MLGRGRRARDAGYEGRLVLRLRRRGEDADYAKLRARAERPVPVWARAVVPDVCHLRGCGLPAERVSGFCAAHDDEVRLDTGTAAYPVPCPACRGTGGGVLNDCGYCGGNGVV